MLLEVCFFHSLENAQTTKNRAKMVMVHVKGLNHINKCIHEGLIMWKL